MFFNCVEPAQIRQTNLVFCKGEGTKIPQKAKHFKIKQPKNPTQTTSIKPKPTKPSLTKLTAISAGWQLFHERLRQLLNENAGQYEVLKTVMSDHLLIQKLQKQWHPKLAAATASLVVTKTDLLKLTFYS